MAMVAVVSLQPLLLFRAHARYNILNPQNITGSRFSTQSPNCLAVIRSKPNRWLQKSRGSRNTVVCADGNDQSNKGNNSSERSIEELEARLGVGRKNRREGGGTLEAPLTPPKPKAQPKKWEDMSLLEQAWELYIGEKGALFWLNKLAYASIYLIIGGWIVFRFIGPALGWYELDSGLLPPSQILAGSGGR